MAREMRMPPRGHVRVQANDRTERGFHVTIPAALARTIGTERLFRVELVNEGILLRPVDEGAPLADALPTWLLYGVKPTEKEEE